MEDGRDDLVGVGEVGGEAIENPGEVGRTVVVGDTGTASVAASSSWLKRKIWLRGRERRLDKVFFPAREATDGVIGLAFSSPLGGRLGADWIGAGCLRDDFPTFLMDRNAWDARALKVLDLDMDSFFPATEGISFPTLYTSTMSSSSSDLYQLIGEDGSSMERTGMTTSSSEGRRNTGAVLAICWCTLRAISTDSMSGLVE